MTANRDAALELAGRGFRVHPIKAGTKVPHLRNWPRRATGDRNEVARLWARHPDADVGIATGAGSGVVVIDVDPRHGGDDALAVLEPEYGQLPATLTASTPSGGRHLYYAHPGAKVTNTAGEIGPGLDVRGDGGQVVAPPADGRQWLTTLPVAALPPDWVWLLAPAARSRPELSPELAQLADPAPPGAATPYGEAALAGEVAKVAAALEGGRNHQLNRSAFKIGQLAAVGEVAPDLAADELGEAARLAGLPDDDIRRTLASGIGDGLHNPRAEVESVSTQAPGTAETTETAGTSGTPAPNRFRDGALTFAQVLSRPSPAYLLAGLLVVKTVAMLVGRRNSAKTFAALAWALCVATGQPWLGRAVRQGPVLFIASEGADGLGVRLRAWSQEHGIAPDAGLFEVYPGPVNLRDWREVAELVAYVRERGFVLVVIDTLNRSIGGGDENAPEVMGRAYEAVDAIRRAGSTVLVLHHPREDGQSRGHKSWPDNAQTVVAVKRSGSTVTLSTDAKQEGKQKDAAPLDLHLELRRVEIPDHPDGSCVLAPLSLVTTLSAELAAGLSQKSAFLDLLRQRRDLGLAVTGGEAANFCAARGIAARTFRDLVSPLVRQGKVHKEGRGRTAVYTLLVP